MKTLRQRTMLAIAAGLVTSTAFAAELPSDTAQSRIVSYSDLKLDRHDSAATLYRRIQNAAREVCRPEFDDRALAHAVSTRACVEQSVARAVSDVNRPELTAYHALKQSRASTLAQRR